MKLLEERRQKLIAYICWRWTMQYDDVTIPVETLATIRAKDGRPPRATIRIIKDIGGIPVRNGHRIVAYRFNIPFKRGDTYAKFADTVGRTNQDGPLFDDAPAAARG